MKRFLLASLVIAALLLIDTGPLRAATILTGPNGCSLADAIRSANSDSSVGNCAAGSGADTIVAPDGWFVTIGSTLPTVASELTIRSESAAGRFTISGDFDHKIFRVNGPDTRLTLERIELINGRVGSATGTGGAALDIDRATVTLLDSEVSGNQVTDNTGSAIHIVDGSLFIENSLIERNSMRVTGNFAPEPTAVYARDSAIDVLNSTFRENTGPEPGLFSAAIYMDGGELRFEGSLIDQFRWGLRGERAVVEIVNSTLTTTDDKGYDDALVAFSDSSAVTLRHVTLSEWIVLGDSILTAVNSLFGRCDFDNVSIVLDAGNFRRTSACGAPADGDGELLTLADNGGPTLTRAIPFPSNMIDHADQGFCEPIDQRGVSRVFACDPGAYELSGFADLRITAVLSASAPFSGGQEIDAILRIANDGPGLATAVDIDLDLTRVSLLSIDSTACPAFPCRLTSLAPGQTTNIPVRLRIQSTVGGDAIIEGSVLSSPDSVHQDPDEADPMGTNFDRVSGAIVSSADVSVELERLTPGPYFPGQSIKYDLVVRNDGPQSATNTTVDLTLSGLNLVDLTGCPMASGSSCAFGTLVPGASDAISVDTVLTDVQFDAVANGFADPLDPNPGNNTDDLGNGGGVEDGNLGVDLVLLTPGPHYGGQFLEFEARLHALQGDLSNIVITSELPGADFIGVDGCSTGLPCRLPFSIPEGTVKVVGIDWFAPVRNSSGPSTWTHTVTAFPGERELDSGDNLAVLSRPLDHAADLAVQMTLVTPPPYVEGQEIQYALRAVNGGLSHATSVNIELVPENLDLVLAVGQQCPTVDCILAGLDRFNEENLTLVYRIAGPGDFDLIATVSAFELDPVPGNNTDDLDNGGTAEARIDLDLIFASGFEP
jgi:hypothetical protein